MSDNGGEDDGCSDRRNTLGVSGRDNTADYGSSKRSNHDYSCEIARRDEASGSSDHDWNLNSSGLTGRSLWRRSACPVNVNQYRSLSYFNIFQSNPFQYPPKLFANMPLITQDTESYENSGPGFGNKTADGDWSHDTSDTRFGSSSNADPYSGATQHGSGTTGGAGFGNKTNDGGDIDTSDTRFGSAESTGAYSSGTQYGSGATGGAGIGNKQANIIPGESTDSTTGKLYEKAGGMLKNEGMVEKGRQKREEAGAFDDDN